MKSLFLSFIVLFSTNILAQQADLETADIEIPITVFDDSGLPDNFRNLICGIDSMATDSIDSFLGEFWLYCAWDIPGIETDCIPYDHFEAVLDIPDDAGPGSFFWGSWKDFRQGMIPYSGLKTYRICYLAYAAATALYISWDFPEGVTGILQDGFEGYFFTYQMPDSGTFTHPILIQFSGSSYGMLLKLTYSNVTPVEMLSFNASLFYDNVKLNWTTATETNNSGFEILRKAQNDNEWSAIGFVPGFGTTTESKSYSFTDESITSGVYKYRLKQIDFDGTFTYSNEIEVDVDFSPKEFVLYQNFPNPFNPSTTIKYEIPFVGTRDRVSVRIIVYDILGNEVTTLVNEEKQPGVYEVEFNNHSDEGQNLSSGIYFYQLKAGEFISIKKMVLLK